ncbi:hypothetical protein [Antarcticirhabdus aurantiaca]|uniref:Uncharacterized protein n=1 Tax=Antarcticirhabdus aurantiaca TaxID=2606717 RepID=A0ACD4NK42_9HYPH|nr:hypothetical protein [Antarcticirhabdus aurantiaca]WAJ27124.1 hypothetical protein OXU80_20040 [Jeongeuplla avenae]
MEEDDDIIAEMDARLDAHRMLLALIIRNLPDRDKALLALQQLESLSRKNNLHGGTIRELAEIRDVLDDL